MESMETPLYPPLQWAHMGGLSLVILMTEKKLGQVNRVMAYDYTGIVKLLEHRSLHNVLELHA